MEPIAIRNVPKRWTRRALLLALAGVAIAVPACEFNEMFAWNDGKPTIFWYKTAPNYDKRIKTVRVKIFKNSSPWAVLPVPGMEMELTQALVREIEAKTPYKVVQGDADTEMSGIIKSFTKINLNYNQNNEVRECQTTLIAEVVWKDLRTNELLSSPSPKAIEPVPPAGLLPGQQDPLNSPNAAPGVMQTPLITAPNSPGGQQATMGGATSLPPPGNAGVPGAGGVPGAPMIPGVSAPGVTAGLGVLVSSIAHFRPEIGESLATGEQKNINYLVEQIVSMMEKPW